MNIFRVNSNDATTAQTVCSIEFILIFMWCLGETRFSLKEKKKKVRIHVLDLKLYGLSLTLTLAQFDLHADKYMHAH